MKKFICVLLLAVESVCLASQSHEVTPEAWSAIPTVFLWTLSSAGRVVSPYKKPVEPSFEQPVVKTWQEKVKDGFCTRESRGWLGVKSEIVPGRFTEPTNTGVRLIVAGDMKQSENRDGIKFIPSVQKPDDYQGQLTLAAERVRLLQERKELFGDQCGLVIKHGVSDKSAEEVYAPKIDPINKSLQELDSVLMKRWVASADITIDPSGFGIAHFRNGSPYACKHTDRLTAASPQAVAREVVDWIDPGSFINKD